MERTGIEELSEKKSLETDCTLCINKARVGLREQERFAMSEDDQVRADERDAVLYVLFQHYAGIGQDKFLPCDREVIRLYELERLAKDTGLASKPGILAVSLQRRALPKRRDVTDFPGFVQVIQELAAIEASMSLEDYSLHVQSEHRDIWEAALNEWASKQPQPSPTPMHLERSDMDFCKDLFEFYRDGNETIDFQTIVRMTKDFQLHPKLCSRRALAQAFQTASKTGELHLIEYILLLEHLASAIFEQPYVDVGLRSDANVRLFDLMKACHGHVADIRSELRLRQRRLSAQRWSRSPKNSARRLRNSSTSSSLSATSFDPMQSQTSLPSDLSPPSKLQRAAPPPIITNFWSTNEVKLDTHDIQFERKVEEPSPLSFDNIGSILANNKISMAKSSSEISPSLSSPSLATSSTVGVSPAKAVVTLQHAETNHRMDQNYLLRAPPSPPSLANHRITIYPDGTIDILRVSYPPSKSDVLISQPISVEKAPEKTSDVFDEASVGV